MTTPEITPELRAALNELPAAEQAITDAYQAKWQIIARIVELAGSQNKAARLPGMPQQPNISRMIAGLPPEERP